MHVDDSLKYMGYLIKSGLWPRQKQIERGYAGFNSMNESYPQTETTSFHLKTYPVLQDKKTFFLLPIKYIFT